MGLEPSDTVPLITDEGNGGHEVSSIEIQKDLSEYIGGEVIDDRVMIIVDQRWFMDHDCFLLERVLHNNRRRIWGGLMQSHFYGLIKITNILVIIVTCITYAVATDNHHVITSLYFVRSLSSESIGIE